MGPNQDMASQPSMQPTPTQPVQPAEPPVQPVQGGSDIVFQDKPKKKTGMVLGMILLLLIAAGGVGFGVWAMMDGNSQKEQLNEQISALKEQNSELIERISLLEEEKESHSTSGELEEGVEYYEMDDLGIKIKKSDNFPDMVVKKNDGSLIGTYIIKKDGSISDDSTVPDVVTWMKSSSCDSENITLGYGTKMVIGGNCYLMSEIVPYGTDPEYPLTDFLEYVMNEDNYLAI